MKAENLQKVLPPEFPGPPPVAEPVRSAARKVPPPHAPPLPRTLPAARQDGHRQPAAAAAAPPRPARPVPVSAAKQPPSGNGRPRVDTQAAEQKKETAEAAIRSAPPWLVSAVVHMAVLIALALFYLGDDSTRQVEILVYSDELGEQLLDDDLQAIQIDPLQIEEPIFVPEGPLVDDPFAAPLELDLAIDATTMSGPIEAPTIGMALTGREQGAREALLAAYGGTGQTEAAVQLGLEWLARQQNTRTGLWSLRGPYSNGAPQENKLAATAMALLAFQGAGNTHQKGKYERNVSRGIEALVAMQDDDGNFFHEGPFHHRLYSQAQATIAICELYGMTKDEKYRRPAQKALDYAARIQTPKLGGWRYEPRVDADTSVTGWFVMAFQSGLMGGLEVPSPTLDAISGFLDRVTEDGVLYSYQRGRGPTGPMTAEALLCRQYLGWERNDPRLLEAVSYLLKEPVDYAADENVYYWYYATQVLHHMGGDLWDQWNLPMRERIPARQVKEGPERGSWDPKGDRWGGHGGRLFTTCLSIYNLEVYYRHLPIYQH